MRFAARLRHHSGIARATGLPLTLALVAVWFALFRPLVLGGPAEYVIVAGHSMEPTFQTGDLAITQRRDAYAVGDVVAFKTSSGIVIHRIVGGDGLIGYQTRGDNKPAIDLWRPRANSVLGKVWFSIPGVGTALALLRQPGVLAAIAAAIAFFLAFTAGPRGVGQRRATPSTSGGAAAESGLAP